MLKTLRAHSAIIALVFATTALVACTPEQPGPVTSETPAYTTPVPAPNGSDIDDVEETAAPVETTTVALDESADVGAGVAARINEVEDLEAKALTPGEIAGPGVALTITIVNDGDKPIDVSSAIVTLLGADGQLGQPTTSDPYRPFAGVIDAGGSSEATYVFLLPEDARSAFDVSVQYRAGTTVARFVDAS